MAQQGAVYSTVKKYGSILTDDSTASGGGTADGGWRMRGISQISQQKMALVWLPRAEPQVVVVHTYCTVHTVPKYPGFTVGR